MNGLNGLLVSVYSVLLCSASASKHGSDEFLNSYQLIQKYGYKPERHSVVTEDDYVVNLFRIPNNGPPVLLVHGIADSSDSWLILGPQESLAFILASIGFDVWMFNARGNKYSKEHNVGNLNRRQYWNFSFEEMGTKDLSATIDHILDTTGYSKLTYIGFSQGTTIFLVLCSQRVGYNEKIEHAILLAPVARIDNIKYPFIEIYSSNLDSLVSLADIVGVYEVFPENDLKNTYHARACRQGTPAKLLCELEYLLSYGVRNSSNVSPDKFPVIGSHIPAGTSARTFLHFLQLYRSKRFQRFDYGKKKNKVIYKSRGPPEYNVSLVTAPITIFASEEDWFSDIEDVQFLKKKLPNVVRYVLLNRSLQFSHIEYVYGSRAKTLINDEVVSILAYEIF